MDSNLFVTQHQSNMHAFILSSIYSHDLFMHPMLLMYHALHFLFYDSCIGPYEIKVTRLILYMPSYLNYGLLFMDMIYYAWLEYFLMLHIVHTLSYPIMFISSRHHQWRSWDFLLAGEKVSLSENLEKELRILLQYTSKLLLYL